MPTNETANVYSSQYEDPTPIAASDITYDNTSSGLTADDVQEAIDEVNGKFANISQFPPLPSDSADGTYVLKATASSGTITYAWVLEV